MTSRSAMLPGTRTPAVALCCAFVALGGAAGSDKAALDNAVREAPRPAAYTAPPVLSRLTELRPRVIVTPDAAFVLLGVASASAQSGNALAFAYLAGTDPRAASDPGAVERVRSTADTLFRALRVMMEVTDAVQFSVTALFGAPGAPGIAQEITYSRAADGWHSQAPRVREEIAATPALPARVERDRTGERDAVDTALRFLRDVDHQKFDDAWDLSSAVVKATMSRTSFEANLRAAIPGPDGDGQRQEGFHTFAPGAFIPGSELDILFARPGAFEAIVLRMDDDMQWRVLGLMAMARREPSATVSEL